MIEQIKNRHYKAWEEDFFSKFMFEYLAFIAYVHRYKYALENFNDRGSIQRLKQDENMKNNYLKIVSEDSILANEWCVLIEELNRKPLWDNSKSNEITEIKRWWIINDEIQQSERIGDIWKITWLQDWWNMVEFWYSIRNNLFHWWKDANNERDKLLIKWAYKTLRPLVEIFINSENIY